jgi:hypothetical protein
MDQFFESLTSILQIDSTNQTRAIHSRAQTLKEINSLIELSITYGKVHNTSIIYGFHEFFQKI